jgi:hypothetical protein
MSGRDSVDADRKEDLSSCPALTGSLPNVEGACCKVERVAEAYGLEGIDAELTRRREQHEATLHELAAYFNERLTAVSLSAADVDIDAEPGTVYAALQNSEELEISRRDEIREAVASRLDIGRLQTDYTSHETVRKHLKEHLGVATARGSIETTEDLQNALRAYEDQYENAVESALARAARQDLLAGTEYRVFSTRIECQECSSTYRLDELLSAGGCTCQD